MRLIPAPSSRRILGHLPAFQADPIGLFTEVTREYGNIVQLRLGPPGVNVKFVLVNEPTLVREVLQHRHQEFRKSIGYRRLCELLGLGLLTSDGEQWRRQRRVAQPHFSQSAMARCVESIGAEITASLSTWNPRFEGGRVRVNVTDWVTSLTLVVAGRALFNTDLSLLATAMKETIAAVQKNIVYRAMLLVDWPPFVPSQENFEHRRRLRFLRRLVQRILATYQPVAGQETVMDALLHACRAGELTEAEVADSVMTFLLAGHETSANALTWALWLVAGDARVQGLLRQEADAVLQENGVITGHHLARLSYTRQVLLESMRLYPPAWLLDRETLRAIQIGGYSIPKGTVVGICSYLLHRDPVLWPRPESLEPERFAGEESWRGRPGEYLPFGEGPRNCIGSHFAFLEMQIAMALILRRFILHPAGSEPVPEPDITLRMRQDLHLDLEARQERRQGETS